MKVTNIKGTGETACKCGSWLKHWEKYNSGRQTLPSYCAVSGCYSKPEVGAHVQKEGGGSTWYILPFCDGHNKKTIKPLEVKAAIAFAPANKSETCDRT